MKKTTVFLISFMAFLLFVVSMAPASLVYRTIQGKINNSLSDLVIIRLDGSIWKGQGEIKYREFPAFIGTWKLYPFHLLALTAKSYIKIKTNGLNAEFHLEINHQGGSVNSFNAVVQDHYLNEVTIPYGLDFSGEVMLLNGRLGFDQNWLTEIEGELTWDGGIVHIQTPDKIHTVNLPPLRGHLSMEKTILKLEVSESGHTMMKIHIRPDGWAKVAIHYSFMRLANLPLPVISGAGEDPAIVLEEKIL